MCHFGSRHRCTSCMLRVPRKTWRIRSIFADFSGDIWLIWVQFLQIMSSIGWKYIPFLHYFEGAREGIPRDTCHRLRVLRDTHRSMDHQDEGITTLLILCMKSLLLNICWPLCRCMSIDNTWILVCVSWYICTLWSFILWLSSNGNTFWSEHYW
jgi:hypothetical protein